MQFYEVDMPKVSQKKIDLVKAVIPDKDKVCCRALIVPQHMHWADTWWIQCQFLQR